MEGAVEARKLYVRVRFGNWKTRTNRSSLRQPVSTSYLSYLNDPQCRDEPVPPRAAASRQSALRRSYLLAPCLYGCMRCKSQLSRRVFQIRLVNIVAGGSSNHQQPQPSRVSTQSGVQLPLQAKTIASASGSLAPFSALTCAHPLVQPWPKQQHSQPKAAKSQPRQQFQGSPGCNRSHSV